MDEQTGGRGGWRTISGAEREYDWIRWTERYGMGRKNDGQFIRLNRKMVFVQHSHLFVCPSFSE